jgi:hypothetical protein
MAQLTKVAAQEPVRNDKREIIDYKARGVSPVRRVSLLRV